MKRKEGRKEGKTKQKKGKVPNVKEIRDVGHAEVEVEGIQESGVGVDVEAVDPGVGKAGSWWWRLLFRKISNGTPPLSSSSS